MAIHNIWNSKVPMVDPQTGLATQEFLRWIADNTDAVSAADDDIAGLTTDQIALQTALGALSLDDLGDVDTTTTPPTDGQVLAYENASSLWKPKTPSAGGSGTGLTVIETALWAAYAQKAITDTTNLSSGKKLDVVTDHGGLVGIGLYAMTSAAFAARTAGATFTVPAGCKAVVLGGRADDDQRTNLTFYSHRLFNVTQNKIIGSFVNASSGNLAHFTGHGWHVSYWGSFTTNMGGNAGAVAAVSFPIAGVAGDVLKAECWTNGDGNYRLQCGAYYIAIVDATTGAMKPIT